MSSADIWRVELPSRSSRFFRRGSGHFPPGLRRSLAFRRIVAAQPGGAPSDRLLQECQVDAFRTRQRAQQRSSGAGSGTAGLEVPGHLSSAAAHLTSAAAALARDALAALLARIAPQRPVQLDSVPVRAWVSASAPLAEDADRGAVPGYVERRPGGGAP